MAVVGISNSVAWDVRSLVGLEQDVEWDVAEAEDATPELDRTCAPCATPPATPLLTRCSPFRQVWCDFFVAGDSRVSWELADAFAGPAPYSFQLQVGETGSPTADDWRDVGPPLVDAYSAVDPERRALGKQLVTHYRVVLTDGNADVHASAPATVLGRLTLRDWIHARELVRQEFLRLRKGPGGVRGFLLKKKRSAAECTRCLDPYTNEVLDSQCPVCNGTRRVEGYHPALPCQYADLSAPKLEEEGNDGPAGWSMPAEVRGTFLAAPLLSTGDVWVDAESDLRYRVGEVAYTHRIRNVPVILSAGLSQLPFHHVAYTIPLGGT